MMLISESCANANARIRLFRIAFGLATENARVSETECRSVLNGVYDGTRIESLWHASGDLPRQEVQLAFLALLCLETSIPRGGRLSCERENWRWRLTASGARVTQPGQSWSEMAMISNAPDPDQVAFTFSPAEVQFAMLPLLARTINRAPSVSWAQNEVEMII